MSNGVQYAYIDHIGLQLCDNAEHYKNTSTAPYG